MREQRDPQERNARLRRIIKAAERQATHNIGSLADAFGGCHALWAEQQRILKEEHGIDWKTPAELNPHVVYD